MTDRDDKPAPPYRSLPPLFADGSSPGGAPEPVEPAAPEPVVPAAPEPVARPTTEPVAPLAPEPVAPAAPQAAPSEAPAMPRDAAGGRTGGKMGERLVSAGLLNAEQVERIIGLQQSQGLRFGEAAIRLGYLTERDIQSALSEQFNYANALQAQRGVDRSLAIAHAPFGREAEAVRQVRAEISLRLGERRRFSLSVVSPNQGEGKSYLAASLALAYSQSGQRVLLIDADLRAADTRKLFKLESTAGLSAMLAGLAPPAAGVPVSGFPLLHVLEAGPKPPNPTEILGNPALRRFIDRLRDEFDVIVVDTPAANRSSDAQIIASQTDVCLLVARQDMTLLSDYLQTQERMRRAGAQLVGAVYNGYGGAQAGPPRSGWRKWLGWR
ncbi:polysaccharide biosynthesis tyrosine autokinase [Orrella sp. JC864]|uniref:polysaccharide biosynthesis tyrosine autokinase n=1 Tax=Orrella sp. JC864 TaxID=3120298 RepID=UPI0030097AD2